MIQKAEERGITKANWLHSYHSFSFANYYNPKQLGYGVLRVLNDDFIAPNTGFDAHSHADMEIITIVLSGAVKHEDDQGNTDIIKAGEAQKMTAGTGIIHSEYNASTTDELRLLQIWITPAKQGLKPGYDKLKIPDTELALIATGDKREKALHINQNIQLYMPNIHKGKSLNYRLRDWGLYIFVIEGKVTVNGTKLDKRDAYSGEESVKIVAESNSQFLLFDLPSQ